jgi:hypothetical protein
MQEQTIRRQEQPGWHVAHIRLLISAALLMLTLLPSHGQAATGESLVNGNFEAGFVSQPHCRWRSDLYGIEVGAGWNCFTNQGAARYGFYADQWPATVADGQTSQLIEINTWGLQSGDNDRYAGIYQSVPTVAGTEYQLSLRGMIRSTKLDGDPWRYRVQVGYLTGADQDWRHVKNWSDVGWNTYYPRTQPGIFSEYKTTFTATSDQTTFFIRVWKKWGLTNEEINVNLDSLSLVKLENPPAK